MIFSKILEERKRKRKIIEGSSSSSYSDNIPLEILNCKNNVLTLDFLPGKSIFAIGDVSGLIEIYDYEGINTQYFNDNNASADVKSSSNSNFGIKKLHKYSKVHQDSCRNLSFTLDGKHLVSVSSDKTIFNMDLGSLQCCRRIEDAHESPINVLIICDDNRYATGDDNGEIRLWDFRRPNYIDLIQLNREFISSFCLQNPITLELSSEEEDDEDIGSTNKATMSKTSISSSVSKTKSSKYSSEENSSLLYAGSGDGSFIVYEMNTRKALYQTDEIQDEILSILTVDNGNQIVAGTGTGNLQIYRCGMVKTTDCVKTGDNSIDCLLHIDNDDDNLYATGSMSGEINLYGKVKNNIRKLGDHEGPINQLAISKNAGGLPLFASCGDNTVKFWNTTSVSSAVAIDSSVAKEDAGVGNMEEGDDDKRLGEDTSNKIKKKIIQSSIKSISQRNIFFKDFKKQRNL